MFGRTRTRLVGNAAAMLRPPPGPQRPQLYGPHGFGSSCNVAGHAILSPGGRPQLQSAPLPCWSRRAPRRKFSQTHCGLWHGKGTQKAGQDAIKPKGHGKIKRGHYRPRISQASQLGCLTHAHLDDGHIKLNFEHHWNEEPVSFPNIWFRDLCQCTHCVSESSGQKRFATCDIDDNPTVQSCRILDDGALEVVWADDFMSRGAAHTSVFPLELLHRLLVNEKMTEFYYPQKLIWDRTTIQQDMHTRTVSYTDWMAGGPSFAAALVALAQWGLVLVKGVPSSKDAVEAIANKIGALQNTFYGATWDVISKPQAENVAYTNEFLCLHQDLMYWSPSPKIQLLHCLANDCEGGDSLFSDGFRAAAEFHLRRPDEWRSLASSPVLFHYARNGNYYSRVRRVIHGPARGPLPRRIHWAPPFQGPFPPIAKAQRASPDEIQKVTESASNKRPVEAAGQPAGQGEPATPLGTDVLADLPAWNRAARAFRDSLEAPENMLQYRLEAGDCVLFDNHRVLHGRTRFDVSGTGHRHLHGAYLDEQTVQSALTRVVREGLASLDVEHQREPRAREAEQAEQMYGAGAGVGRTESDALEE